jgi:hypothetical protein
VVNKPPRLAMEGVRLAGMIVMAVSAWNRSLEGVVFGAAVVLFGWLRGVLTSTMTAIPDCGGMDSSRQCPVFAA